METKADNPSVQARRDILTAALQHIPFDGWTVKSLKQAVQDAGLPQGAEALYFPGGVIELIQFWSEEGDRLALEAIETRSMKNMRIRDKITECVWIRLSQMDGQEEVARRAMSRLSFLDTIGKAPQHIWASADMIWRAIGDTSTDGNYYSKRTILSGVIGASIVSWLSDMSEDKAKARAFLDGRIDNVMQFEKVKASARKRRAGMPSPTDMLSRLRYRRRRRRY